MTSYVHLMLACSTGFLINQSRRSDLAADLIYPRTDGSMAAQREEDLSGEYPWRLAKVSLLARSDLAKDINS